MFRCRDCGCEFEIKPDFCDCGNDTFDEIVAAQPTPDIEMEYDKNVEPAREKTPKRKKTFDEQYPMLSSFLQSLDPISVIIFLLCIILSIGSFFVIKPNENPETPQEQTVAENKPRTVPDINTFWDDTPPKADLTSKKTDTEEDKNIITQVMDMLPKIEEKTEPATVNVPKKTEQPKTTVNNTKKQNTTKTTTQKTSTQKTTTPKTTTQTNSNKTQTQAKTQTQSQTQTQTKTQPVTTQNKQQPQTYTVTKTETTIQPQTKISPTTTITTSQNTQELKNYKDGLKRTIFAKMNLLNVYGDGACTVDFKIDSSGKLINRSFSKQSTNNTLNDEVYNAIMSTPTYKAPPGAYNGQVLHFSVKISNGQFAVTLN